MANDRKKRRALEKEVGQKMQCYDQGHFLPKLTTKRCYDSPVASKSRRQNRSEAQLVKRSLIKETDTKKVVRFARHLELWTEYDRETGVLLGRKDGCKNTDDCRTLRCRLRNKQTPSVDENAVLHKSSIKALKLTPRVQNISDAVQSVQRQRHGVKIHPKISIDKYRRFKTKEEEEKRQSELEYSVNRPQDCFPADRSRNKDFRFTSTQLEKVHSNSVKTLQTFSDDSAPFPRRPGNVRQRNRAVLLPPSAEFKACAQCTLPPLYDERKALDRRGMLPVAAGEEHVNTDEYRQTSNKNFGSLALSNTPHIVQLFE